MNTKRLVKPPAYRRTSRSLLVGRRYDLDRRPAAQGRIKVWLSKGFIGPETQKIAWDFIWGHSAAEADTLKHENSPKIWMVKDDVQSNANRHRSFYRRTSGDVQSHLRSIGARLPCVVSFVAQLALENIATSDAAYHDVNHTIMVTLVGQEILRGRHINAVA